MNWIDSAINLWKNNLNNHNWEPIYKNKNELRKNKIKQVFEIDMYQSNDGTLGSYPNS